MEKQVMTKLQRINWDPIYSVHVEILDEQHKKLFETVNHLIEVFESGSGDFISVFNKLIEYISGHFHQEHIVMMNSGFPGFAAHSREHQQFIEKVEEFMQSYKAADQDLGINMVVYMKNWIRNHTTTIDMEYAEHLLKKAARAKRS
jgi:hemerythrin-like metal-binding protein